MEKELIEQIIELRERGYTMKEIGSKLGFSYLRIKHECRKVGYRRPHGGVLRKHEVNFKTKFNLKYPNFEYLHGYKNCESRVTIKCKVCGDVTTRSARCIRGNERIRCRNCDEIKRLESDVRNDLVKTLKSLVKVKKQEEEEFLENKKRNQIFVCTVCGIEFRYGDVWMKKFCSTDCLNKHKEQLESERNKERICEECGSSFTMKGSKRKSYCSEQCCKRNQNRRKELKNKFKNAKIDYSISLKKLYERDNGVCYICGEMCDWEDYGVRDCGTIICGDRYPSIEHIVPASRGGSHTWDNVALAHRHCNTMKSNHLIYNTKTNQLRLSL